MGTISAANTADLYALGEAQDRARDLGILGHSDVIAEARGRIRKLASTSSNVLITGETGVGKELVAQAIHNLSSRRGEPFVSLNCAAIPDTLVESELFGVERGAFTGAVRMSRGKLDEAAGGTVFLDEVGELSQLGQAKMLRAIESKRVCRLGGAREREIDFRILAATNEDLEGLVRAGAFRKDLFYRLNVVSITMPPLRERPDDIGLLAMHFVRLYNQTMGRRIQGFTDEALAYLCSYDWPGNVRELRNTVEAAFVDVASGRIGVEVLPIVVRSGERSNAGEAEKERLLRALYAVNWNKSRAAQRLSWSRMTLYRKLEKHGIEGPSQGSARAASLVSKG